MAVHARRATRARARQDPPPCNPSHNPDRACAENENSAARSARSPLSRSRRKNFQLSFYRKICSPPSIPPHAEGRTRRHDTLRRGAVAAGLSGAFAQDDCQHADVQAVWSWRPDAGAKPDADLTGCAGDGGKQAGPRGELGADAHPSRREGRVCPAEPVVPAACIFSAGGPRASVEVRPSLRPRVSGEGLEHRFGRVLRCEGDGACAHGGAGILDMLIS